MSLNEHFFESLLAQMPGDLVVLDMDFRYVYVNPQAVRDPEVRKWIIGKTDEEYCAYRKIPEHIAERRRNMLNTVRDTKNEFELEECLTDSNGACRYFLRRVKPFFNANGEFTHFLGYGVEITEQKNIRFDLEKNRNFIQQILDASPQLIFIKDNKGNVIQGNKALSKLINFDSSQFADREVEDIYRDIEEYNQHVEADRKVIEENVMVRVEEKFTDRHGEVFYFDSIKIPFPGDNGETNVLSISTDITNQKKAREELLESRQLLYNAEQLTKAGSYQFDLITGKIEWSPGLFLIWERPEELGAPSYDEFLEQVHPHDRKLVQSNMEIIMKEKRAPNMTYRIICPEREIKYVQTYSQIKFNEDGHVIGIVGSLVDVTEQKIAEQEILKAKQLAEDSVSVKEKFMASVGHEMRTPLNGVLGMSRLLQKTQLSQTQKKYINVLNSTAENLLVIINDLLDVAKIESGTLSFDRVPFDINQVADTAIQIKLLVAEEKGLVLNHLTDKKFTQKVMGDPYRVNQVLLNLIGNAVKYTHKGEVTLSHKIIKQENNTAWIQFIVKDSGIGISETDLNKIFNSFTQINPITNDNTAGLGLGLSIVKSIVEQMGGEITVKSKLGKGSEFSVILPFEICSESDLISTDTSERLMMTSLRVLLAEDNLVNQFIVQAMLQDWGFKVDVASNGEEAIELFKSNNYEIILMDIQMPVMDGMQATEYIRNYQDEKKSKTPIIALTANPSRQFQKKFLNAGMEDVIVKPFKDDALYKKIVALCSGNANLINVVKRKFPARKKPVTVNNKLYDLSFLENEIGPNKEFMQRMLSIFIETIPEAVAKMQTHFDSGEMDAVATIAHKIKPTIDGAGIKSLYETIRTVEGYRDFKISPTQMKINLTKIHTTINQVVEDFKKEIELLSDNSVSLN